jgi:hypothetical protein
VKHRHLNHEEFSLAAIDDIIDRGALRHWLNLLHATYADPALLGDIRRLCTAQADNPCAAERYAVWARYAARQVRGE